MTWLAVARGASGVLFHPERLRRRRCRSAPSAGTFIRAAAEVNGFRKVLEKGKPAALPGRAGPAFAARAWRQGGRDYLLLLNPTGAALPLAPVKDWRPLFEASRYLPETLSCKALLLEK